MHMKMIGRVDSIYNQRLSPPRSRRLACALSFIIFLVSKHLRFLLPLVLKMEYMVQKLHTFTKVTKVNDAYIYGVCDGPDGLVCFLMF